MSQNTRVVREVPAEWDRLMRLAAKIGKGSCVVIFNEGRPVQVENVVQKIALDKPEEFDRVIKVVSLMD